MTRRVPMRAGLLRRPVSWSPRPGRAAYAAGIVVLAGAYYGAAKLGLSFAFATPSVTAIWPPTGLALAALVLGGYRLWPGVAIGAFLANSWSGIEPAATVGITCGNTLEALAGAYLLRRVAGFRPTLERVRDVFALVILAAGISTAISATIGVASLLAIGEVAAGGLAAVWRVWWLGDMGGDLLVAPVLLVFAAWWPLTRLPGRAIEAAALAVATVAVSALVFSRETNLAYVVFPLLIWAALRFWQPGATATSLIIAAIAVTLTSDGSGPFMAGNPDDSLLLAQTFVGVSGVTVMLLAATTTQRRLADDALVHVARTACCRRRSPASLGSRAPRASAPRSAASWSAAISMTCSRPPAGAGRSSSATSAARGRRRLPPLRSRATHSAPSHYASADRARSLGCSTRRS